MEAKQQALVLMGIKHCGKSTQGRLLSAHFACPFYDTDAVIEAMTGKTPRELYTHGGEGAFMAAEADACSRIVATLSARAAAQPFSAVIATGGGICNNSAALKILHAIGTFVFLNTDESVAADRIVREVGIENDGSLTNLPAYIAKEKPRSIPDVRAAFHRFFVARVALYQNLADITVPLAPATPEANMNALLSALALLRV